MGHFTFHNCFLLLLITSSTQFPVTAGSDSGSSDDFPNGPVKSNADHPQTVGTNRFPEYDEIDQALFYKARFVEENRKKMGESNVGSPKVAFMFLTRGVMPLDTIWERFFKGHEELYSIYIMSPPGFEYNASTTTATTFFHKQIISNFKVSWAGNNVLRAERRLLAVALSDPRNSAFVLLSDSCIPLWNISYIHSYLTSSRSSYLASFGTDMRWEDQYEPEIPKSMWRKGSQWFSLIRDHALLVINDTVIFDTIVQRSTKNILNEHYIQTLIAMKDAARLENRPVTYVEWRPGDFLHPHMFQVKDLKLSSLQKMRNRVKTRPVAFKLYKGFSDSSLCTINGEARQCYLFARKFDARTRHHILHLAENLFFL